MGNPLLGPVLGICPWLEVSCSCPDAGFSMLNYKCSYALQWLISFPVEVVAASEVIAYWNKSLPRAIFVTIFVTFIISINMLGVKAYGEAEFIFAVIKITAVIGFM
jgi:amino acid transporter